MLYVYTKHKANPNPNHTDCYHIISYQRSRLRRRICKKHNKGA